MIDKGLITKNIEDFELEDMKGASGLRALRIEVNYDTQMDLDNISLTEIKQIVGSN
jgi:hypothetical protein